MNIPKTGKAVLACLLGALLFGFSFIFIRMCVIETPLFTMLSWRNIIAVTAMTICVKLGGLDVHLKGKNIKPLLLLSLYQPVLYYIFEAVGVKLTTASESGVMIACIPIVTMIFSTVFLKDKPTKMQIVCMVMTVLGAVIVAGIGGLQASGNIGGYIILLLAVCCDAAFSTTSQSLKDFTGAEKTYVMCISGTIAFTIGALIQNGIGGTLQQYFTLPFTDVGFLVCVLYLSIGCNVIAFLSGNYAISIIGATRRAAFAGVSTVVTVIAGVFILGESFSLIQGIATVLILVGATGVNLVGDKERIGKVFIDK